MMESREKMGVFTGGYVTNPLSGEDLPVWIADYVLPGYGTGAVMGVPAHDPRDFEFARKYGLPVRVVIAASPDDISARGEPDQIYSGAGVLVNSGEFDGLSSQDAAQRICERLEENELGKRTGHAGSVHQPPWPDWDPELAKVELVQIAVQVNGKLRQVIDVNVPGKILNFVPRS